jgi:16S rRNA processing protein RimM
VSTGLWACGTVGRAHGLKGEFYLDLLPNGLSYLTRGERFFVERPGSDEPRPVELARAGGTDVRPLFRLAGVDSREAVIGLQGSAVLAAGPDLDEGTDHYPVSELLGLRAVSGGVELGIVTEVLMNPAHDIIQVDAPDGTRSLIPFVAELVDVDREHGLLTVREGLL